MTSLKLVDAVRRFGGNGTEDLEMWLDRFKVALTVTGSYKTDADRDDAMVSMMPLFLEGNAYSTWKQLSDVDKKDLAKVTAALRRVYGVSKISAWKRIKEKRLYPGELIDVVVDELRGLLKIVIGANPPDELLSLMLVDTLPKEMAAQVILIHGEKMDLSSVMSCAKSLQISQQGAEAFAAVSISASKFPDKSTDLVAEAPAQRCHCCKRIGHLRRDCPVTCYRCGQKGHYRRDCRLTSGNGQAGSALPDRVGPADEL